MATPKQIITTRLPLPLMAEVRRIADQEGESQGYVLRRLLRAGLEAEQRTERVEDRG